MERNQGKSKGWHEKYFQNIFSPTGCVCIIEVIFIHPVLNTVEPIQTGNPENRKPLETE